MREIVKSAKWRVEERSNTQAHDTWMIWRALHLGPMSRATLLNMRANTRNVTCEGVLFTAPGVPLSFSVLDTARSHVWSLEWLCDKVVQRLWFWRTQGSNTLSLEKPDDDDLSWTNLDKDVTRQLLGRFLWLDRLDIKHAVCQLSTHVGHSYHFVMKSTSSVCWDIWFEILHATWTLVAILVFLVLWAFRKVRSWCWRRQRPSQLFWNCNLGQKISWKHMVYRVCVLWQAEHGLFEFWWIRTDGTGLESLRGNRKERPMEQVVQMLTFKRLCCALTAQQLWDSWYAKVRVDALATWTRRSTLCKPGRWNLDNVSWRYMVTVNKLTTASQRLQLLKQLIATLLDFDRCSNLSNIDEGVRKIAAHQTTASDMNTFCFPRRKRSSFGAFCSSSAEAIFASSTSKIWNSNSSYR